MDPEQIYGDGMSQQPIEMDDMDEPEQAQQMFMLQQQMVNQPQMNQYGQEDYGEETEQQLDDHQNEEEPQNFLQLEGNGNEM